MTLSRFVVKDILILQAMGYVNELVEIATRSHLPALEDLRKDIIRSALALLLKSHS